MNKENSVGAMTEAFHGSSELEAFVRESVLPDEKRQETERREADLWVMEQMKNAF